MPTLNVIGLSMYAQMLLLVLYCMIDATEAGGSVSASPEQKKRKCGGGGVDDKCFVHP